MSKEQEARQQRTVPPTVPNPNPQSAATAYVYNPTEPGTYAVPPPVGNQIYGGHGFCAPGPRSKKSVIEAYILFLTLGLLGAHHFYLKVSDVVYTMQFRTSIIFKIYYILYLQLSLFLTPC